MEKKNIYEWICYLVVGTFVSFLVYGIFSATIMMPTSIWIRILLCIASAAGIMQLYRLFEKLYSGESHLWTSLYHNIKSVLWGCGLVGGLFGLFTVVLYLFGCYEVDTIQFAHKGLLNAFFLYMVVGVAEEVIFRGVIFRLIRERWNLGVALVVSALFFGFTHQFNDHATAWSSAAIAITSGVLFGIIYEYYKTLWVPIGMHWAWNFIEGNVLGYAVSGYNESTSMIKPIINGNALLTGGDFGPEASIIVVGLGTVISIRYFVLLKSHLTS